MVQTWIEQFNKGEINADTTFKIQKQILIDEIEDGEFLGFAIEQTHKLTKPMSVNKLWEMLVVVFCKRSNKENVLTSQDAIF